MRGITDKQMEASIGRMLRVGVTTSAAIVLLGGILYLRQPSTKAPDYSNFIAQREWLPNIVGVLQGAAHLNAGSIIQLGILLLIATPITRVAFCIAGFARQKDRIYILISSSVLVILIYSLLQGGR
jgi:uncharacterized membrane protein